MKPETIKKICQAHLEVEEELGSEISEETTRAVLKYCIRKLKRIGKEEDYLPILYKCELPMQIAMKELNRISEAMYRSMKEGESYVLGMQNGTLSPQVS